MAMNYIINTRLYWIIVFSCLACPGESFVSPARVGISNKLDLDRTPLKKAAVGDDFHRRCDDDEDDDINLDRRRALFSFVTSTAAVTVGAATNAPRAAVAADDATTTTKNVRSLSEEYRQGTAVLGSSDEDAVLPREAYKKTPSGLIYADTRTGSGPVAAEGMRANVQWVLRRSNGYFVDSSAVDDGKPFVWRIGDATAAIAGVDEGVRGMRVGGTRRLLVPPALAYVEGLEDGKPGPLPVGFGPRQQMRRVMRARKDVPGEYLYLEIQLTRLRD